MLYGIACVDSGHKLLQNLVRYALSFLQPSIVTRIISTNYLALITSVSCKVSYTSSNIFVKFYRSSRSDLLPIAKQL